MNSWEEIINTLPSDEDLERMQKDGTLDEVDRKLKLLEETIKRMKERTAKEDKELEEMLNNSENTINDNSTLTK